ncbi:MAG: amino acid adenylation domain-containing protein [Acidobacteriota bacterium]
MNVEVEDVYELSPMQQGILFHTLYEETGDLYVEQCVVTLRGDLEPARLERAWQTAVRRYAILRTSFHWEDLEKPVQVVHRDATLALHFADWSLLPETSRAERLQQYLITDRARGFDLAVPPLLRVAAFRTGESLAECVLTFQHLLLDRWSRFRLLKEVVSAYSGSNVWDSPPRPYGDYVAWVQNQDPGTAETFWRRSLIGVRAASEIAGDASGDAPLPTRADIQLSQHDTAALQSFARRDRLTVNTVLQGAWAVLTSRHVGEEDVLFGTTVSGRPPALAGIEEMIGLFINTLPVRLRVSGEKRISAFLSELQGQLLEMREYEHSSLIDIQGWSEIPRGLPLFNSVVIFENTGEAPEPPRSGDLAITGIRSVGGATNLPLTVFAVPGERISFTIQSNTAAFSNGALSRIADQLKNILCFMVRQPDATVSEISLLSESDLQRLLVDWNDTHRDYPATCIHTLVERMAEESPDRPAARFAETIIDYRSLNERSNQVAHALRDMGVQPEARVLLGVERSLEMLIALLGILKAGAVYVPLDPTYPVERLAFVTEDADPFALISQTSVLSALPVFRGPVMLLDRDNDSLARQSTQNLDTGATPHQLAYVIYTSGSTGTPKGVAVEHHSVVNLLFAMQERLALTSKDVLLAVTSLSFDIAGLELFLPLSVGASVAIVSREIAADGHALREEIGRTGATIMQATPATWRLLRESGWRGGDLRSILCGGESLTRDLANQLLETGSDLWNLYGPTETTIWSTAHRIERRVAAATAPIGQPIGNTRLYVLDARGKPVPEGVNGELYIAGAGVARGYWRRSELTDSKFARLPFDTAPSLEGRSYATGDQVRYLADGTLQFLGRSDGQIKIRGFRIELGEIEAVLRQVGGVRDAVVAAREDPAVGKTLVAYLVWAEGAAPSLENIRALIARKLPDYMMPSAFVPIERVPLTPNGKVDRRSLPAPARAGIAAQSFTAPETSVEKELAEIWKDILKIDRPSLEDSFFERGGHSLLATRLVSRIVDSFNTRIPLREVFEHPTLGGLAASIASAMATVQTSGEMLKMLAEVQSLSDAEAQDRLVIESQSDPVKVARPGT